VTIVVAVNAVDSLVLASDSTTTQQMAGPQGQPLVVNTWNSANKIFNLRKAWPVGALTWGQASLGGRSIATLAKELRCRFSGERSDHADWALDPDSYTIEGVAERVKSYFYDEHYQNEPAPKELLGLMVAGYSAQSDAAELRIIQMDQSGCQDPEEVQPAGKPFLAWRGQPEAISRIANGISGGLGVALLQLGVPASNVPDYVKKIQEKTALPLVSPGMPVGEVIDLAEFLVDATIKFVRFAPGHQTVGGPVEIAALTRHEGFKWIKRKHHYPQSLNVAGTSP
jgi:hypothetical protein